MNATPTTLSDVLRRWTRGIARASLLAGALAGLTLGTVANAQIAFRAAAQAGTAGSSTITFRAAASAGVGSGVTALTIAMPTGTLQSDVMIASIAVRPQTIAITPPAGWTLVQRIDNATATANSLAVYRRVAGAGETGPYTWTVGSTHTGATGGIQTFAGVDTSNPIDVYAGQNTPNGTLHATPSVITTVANTMVVASFGVSNPGPNHWTPPTGMTEAFDGFGGSEAIEGAYVLQAAAGATGAKSATSAVADSGNAHILALRPGADLTITKPTGTVQNDVMIASVAVRPNTVTVTPPAGWTQVRRIDITAGTTNSLVVYQKVAGASEPAGYTWTLSAHTGAVGGIATFTGVDTASPINVENGQVWTGTANMSGFNVEAPSVTTTVANAMLVTSYAGSSSGTSGSAWTPPTGMTEAVDISSTNGTAGESIEVSYVVQASAGATGTKTATIVGHDDDSATAHILALRPMAPATLSSAANQTFTVGQAATVASTLTVTDAPTATIKAAQDLRIRIPATFNMTWDPSVTTVTLGGGAAGKVSATLLAYEDGNKTAVLNVTTNFAASDQLTVAGLKFANFTAVSAADNLQLVVVGTGGATAATDDKTITIVAAGPAVISAVETISGCGAPAGIALVAAAQAGIAAPTTTLTINKPTGTVQNHVMVASIGFRLNSPGVASTDIGVTPPAGWTLVRRLDNANSTSSGLAVYRKVAGASEPANYSWTFFNNGPTWTSTGWSGAVGGIVSFSGVETTTPIGPGEENGVSTSVGAYTLDTPSITTAVANSMLVTSHAIPNADTWANPPTSGMTQAFQLTSGPEMVQVSYALQAAAGATGTKRATDLGPDAADMGNAHILALRPATVTNLTLPSWTPQANELLLVGIAMRDETIAHSVSGNGLTWTLIADRDNDRGEMGVALYRASGPSPSAGPIAITLTGNTLPAFAVAVRLSNVDTAVNQGIEAVATASGPAVTDDANMRVTVTTVTPNAMALAWGGQRGSGTLTVPAQQTIIAQSGVDCGTSGDRMRGHMWGQIVATPAPTVLGQNNSLSAAQPWAVIGVSIKPIGGGAPTPGAFNAFETGTAPMAITGVIRTKVAGSAFSLDVVAISGGAQQAAFTDPVIVELLGNNTLGVSLDAQNCPTSSTLVQTVSPNPTITGGRSTVNFAAVANSWRDVRVRVRWPAASPTVTWCSTDNFAIRPNTLASFAVTDTDWQTAGTGRALNLLTFAATTPTHKAGRPFSVRATAVNSAAATTTNYVGAPTATLTACVGAACTATFGTLTLAATFVAGQLTSDVASYNNVGSFALQLVDSTFASVDAADSTGDCSATGRYVCSATINVGRFVPDHFAVALNTPVFAPACGSFSYIGQAFNYSTAPVILVTAQDFANNTTTLYNTAGSWWRITNASLTGKAYTAAVGTLDVSGLPGTDPVIVSAGSGTGTLTFGSGTGIFFTRSTPTAPASPYDADLSLAINVIDADGVTLASNPARFGTATAGNGISFSDGNVLTTNDKQMRFGRLVIRNANGSQLVALPIQVEAQYWSGAPMNAFITNTQDSCTSIASANDAMGNYTGNLSASPTCETAISGGGTLSAGRRTLQLAAPGSGNNGSVDLTVNLGATASGNTCTTVGGVPGSATTANLPHLQGNWTGGAYNANPSARATFGVFKGAGEVIFLRENF